MALAPSDIWRVRVVRLDEYETIEFEQHDDILYRSVNAQPVEIVVNWRVDIVGLSDGKVRRQYEYGDDRPGAKQQASSIAADLASLGADAFSERYLVVP